MVSAAGDFFNQWEFVGAVPAHGEYTYNSTLIRYDVPAGGGRVTIEIFDVNGRPVRTLVEGVQTPGTKTVTWDGDNDRGEDVATGLYLCRMTAPGFEQTRKLTLLR
jgi:flagellar hook assembly protein FlgD